MNLFKLEKKKINSFFKFEKNISIASGAKRSPAIFSQQKQREHGDWKRKSVNVRRKDCVRSAKRKSGYNKCNNLYKMKSSESGKHI